MEKFETPPDSPPVIVIDPNDQPMWSSTRTVASTPSSAIVQLHISNNFHINVTHMQIIQDNQFDGEYDDPTQVIHDAGGIFLYNTLNEAFKILKDNVLLKLDFSEESQNIPKPKTVVSASGSNIDSYHAILLDKFEAIATKINFEFLIIRKELKEMRDGRKDNQASQIYMKDNTPMCEPHEANYVQGYHDQNPIDSYSYPNQNRHHSYLPNRMPHPSRYFKLPKTSTEEMMREWMARQTEANERIKNQVVELENQINQGLRNRQEIIKNLEIQFKYLKKTQQTKSFPRSTNTKLRLVWSTNRPQS
ncbi:hypothetical protein Tco_0713212 [Tanacetum coccineum]